MVDARMLTMLNIFALFGVAGRLFYFSPLDEEWLAPKHAFLLEDHAPAPVAWMCTHKPWEY